MRSYSLRLLLWAGPAVTIAATLVIWLYFTLTKALGEQYRMPLDGSNSNLVPMPILMPVIATLAAGLLASILFGLLIRFGRSPTIVFLSVCAAAVVLSFGGPIYLPGAAVHTKILLIGMNLIAGGIITLGILLFSFKKTKVA